MSPSQPVTLFASAARTVTPAASAIFDGLPALYRGILLLIDVTAVTSTPSVVFDVDAHTSAGWTTQLASAAVTDSHLNTTRVLVCHPDATTDRANLVEKTAIVDKWRVTATHGNANSITYNVKAFFLP
jgi:hypothetical protein